jgi:tyrosyl-tRNA synthetase
VPTVRLEPGERLDDGVDVAVVLHRSGLAGSLGEARRQLEQGGVSVNGQRVEPGRSLASGDLLHGRWTLLRKGKRDWALLDAGP